MKLKIKLQMTTINYKIKKERKGNQLIQKKENFYQLTYIGVRVLFSEIK